MGLRVKLLIYKHTMNSPEQTNTASEQPIEEESVKEITTPEEAAEITRQRREWFNLGEARELTPKELEVIEKSIAKLLENLDEYNPANYSAEIQDEWYYVEQEAVAGQDRELAEAVLMNLLRVLREKTEQN